jgi:O-antigen/teichoic acid export membrane protein
MSAAKRVALNTAVLYGRMLITMGITLYSTRIVLNALGSAEYGIFNLVAGVILMMSFLNTAMATSTQRYLSFYQGKKDLEMQKKVFTNSLFLHFLIGIVIVSALQIIGLFLFKGFLNIPADRLADARTLFSFMSVTVFFTIMTVPFNGSLAAHENMIWGAMINILEAVLKLGIALMLFVVSGDKLVIYGLLTASVSIVSFLLNAGYCLYKYEECTFKGLKQTDKGFIKELSSFAGWNLFGAICGLGQTQGLAIILNLFFGTVVNAAYGIANQASSQLKFFSVTMLRSLNPQIMKSEGANDRKRMLRLSMMASKFGFFLLLIFAIPCILEMESLLHFWLKKVPDNTVIFCQLILITGLVNQLTVGLQSAVQALGQIKLYQAAIGTILLINLPLAYFLLYSGLPPYIVLVSCTLIEAIACVFRLLILKKLAGLSIPEFFSRVLYKELIPVVSGIVTACLLTRFLHMEYRFLITIPVTIIVCSISIYLNGLCEDEKSMVDKILRGIIFKISSLNIKSKSA